MFTHILLKINYYINICTARYFSEHESFQLNTYFLPFYSKTNEMYQFFKFILFCSSILHVSDSLSDHHQEFKTVHTASGVCQTDSAHSLLAVTRRSILFPLTSSR
jgi:hypothetical protein